MKIDAETDGCCKILFSENLISLISEDQWEPPISVSRYIYIFTSSNLLVAWISDFFQRMKKSLTRNGSTWVGGMAHFLVRLAFQHIPIIELFVATYLNTTFQFCCWILNTQRYPWNDPSIPFVFCEYTHIYWIIYVHQLRISFLAGYLRSASSAAAVVIQVPLSASRRWSCGLPCTMRSWSVSFVANKRVVNDHGIQSKNSWVYWWFMRLVMHCFIKLLITVYFISYLINVLSMMAMFDFPRIVEISTPSTDFEKFHDLSTAVFWERPSFLRGTHCSGYQNSKVFPRLRG